VYPARMGITSGLWVGAVRMTVCVEIWIQLSSSLAMAGWWRASAAACWAWPHGFFVDHEGFVWVTDGGTGAWAEADSRAPGLEAEPRRPDSHDAGDARSSREWSPVLRRAIRDTCGIPSGTIYIADGHGDGRSNRIVKYASAGTFLMEWGVTGPGPAAGEKRDAHALAIASQGRLFGGDRGDTSIQIFDQNEVP